MIAKITANIAKLTERKDNLAAEIKTLRNQRAAMKAAPAPAATIPAAPKAKTASKAAAPTPAKAVKASAKKK